MLSHMAGKLGSPKTVLAAVIYLKIISSIAFSWADHGVRCTHERLDVQNIYTALRIVIPGIDPEVFIDNGYSTFPLLWN